MNVWQLSALAYLIDACLAAIDGECLANIFELCLVYLIVSCFFCCIAGECLATISSCLLDCKVFFLLPLLVNVWQLSLNYVLFTQF